MKILPGAVHDVHTIVIKYLESKRCKLKVKTKAGEFTFEGPLNQQERERLFGDLTGTDDETDT